MDELREQLSEGSKKALLLIKIFALVSALILLITFWSVPKTNCDSCSFDGQSAEKFMGEYYNECLNHPLVQSFPLNLLNQTEDNSP